MPTWFWIVAEVLAFLAGFAVASSWAKTVRIDLQAQLSTWFRVLEETQDRRSASEIRYVIEGYMDAMKHMYLFRTATLNRYRRQADGMLNSIRLGLDPRRWREAEPPE